MSRKRKSILFLCTGNSCRSQMAEGWARFLAGDRWLVRSAGVESHGLNPLAVRAMAEAGVDISNQWSKLIEELDIREFDHVITVCDRAAEHCPVFTGKARLTHHSFADPPRLAASAASEDEAFHYYRLVCQQIRDFIENLLQRLEVEG